MDNHSTQLSYTKKINIIKSYNQLCSRKKSRKIIFLPVLVAFMLAFPISFYGFPKPADIMETTHNSLQIASSNKRLDPNLVLYKITSDGDVVFVASNVFIVNSTFAMIRERIFTSLTAKTVYNSTCSVRLSSLQLQIQTLSANTQEPGCNDSVQTEYVVGGSSHGFIDYIYMSAVSENAGINFNYSAHLLAVGWSILNDLRTMHKGTEGYFFIPRLIAPFVPISHGDTNPNYNNTNNRASASSPKDPELKLYERDNTFSRFPVWHLFTSLTMTSFGNTQNCYTDLITAQADSYLLNWRLKSDHLYTVSITNSIYSEVTAYGTAHFCGVFAYPPNFLFWNAYPNVTVCEFNSQKLRMFSESGFFHDPIQASTSTIPILAATQTLSAQCLAFPVVSSSLSIWCEKRWV